LAPSISTSFPPPRFGTDDQFAELAKGGDYIGRMQLYTKSKANMKGLIPQGHYGIPESTRKSSTWAPPWTCSRWPAGRRPSTLTDMEALVISYDHESEESRRGRDKFHRIRIRFASTPTSWSFERSPAVLEFSAAS